ncbi:MAG: hypothetical protein H0Z37_01430 [Firmicutes bacterium]|nr:hypothetical protein [Bacillota bacterium]
MQGHAAVAGTNPETTRARRLSAPLAVGLVLAGALVAGVLYFALARPVQVLPRMNAVPPFQMADQRGGEYRFPDRARPVNVFVVAASWDERAIHPAAHLLEGIWQEADARGWLDRMQLAWITPDPENEDPQSLASLAGRVPVLSRAGVPVLLGAPVAVRMAVGAGFGIYVGASEDGRAVYEPAVVLVDDRGILRGRYSVRSVTSDRLTRDIGLLINEYEAEGAGRVLFEAAHLFVCYPR